MHLDIDRISLIGINIYLLCYVGPCWTISYLSYIILHSIAHYCIGKRERILRQLRCLSPGTYVLGIHLIHSLVYILLTIKVRDVR
jgi:hypothetical protein